MKNNGSLAIDESAKVDEHVCMKQPCTFCMVRQGHEPPTTDLVTFRSLQPRVLKENRAAIERIVLQLSQLDLARLEQIEFIVGGIEREIREAPTAVKRHLTLVSGNN